MLAKSKYQHLFFDLDHTLWDFETNSMETLFDLYHQLELMERNIEYDKFVDIYHLHNKRMWKAFELGEITRVELRVGRFHATLLEFAINDYSLAVHMAESYLTILPTKNNLMPGCKELLEYLSPKYEMHLITNGFTNVQHHKINNAGLKPFFKNMITSEEAKSQKPEPAIFNFAFAKTGALPHHSLMIGDNPTADIAGAHQAGMDTVFFNPTGYEKATVPVTHEIAVLTELFSIL